MRLTIFILLLLQFSAGGTSKAEQENAGLEGEVECKTELKSYKELARVNKSQIIYLIERGKKIEREDEVCPQELNSKEIDLGSALLLLEKVEASVSAIEAR